MKTVELRDDQVIRSKNSIPRRLAKLLFGAAYIMFACYIIYRGTGIAIKSIEEHATRAKSVLVSRICK